MSPRTDYLCHDAEYVRRKAAGQSGWATADSLNLTLVRMDAFLADLPASSNGSLLELGCGAGDIGLHWAAKGWQVFGVDIAPSAIAWAQEKAAAAKLAPQYFIGDATQTLHLSIPPVDLVLDGHCFHCIIGEDRKLFLRNAWAALKSGGVLHINTMCGDPKNPHGRKQFDPKTRCIIAGSGVAVRYFGKPDAICAEVTDAGFAIAKSQVLAAKDENDEDCLMINAVRP